jgi:hypothetical protein
MPIFHVLVWKDPQKPGDKTEPVEKYMIDAASNAAAIEAGTERFLKANPGKNLNDYRVQATTV